LCAFGDGHARIGEWWRLRASVVGDHILWEWWRLRFPSVYGVVPFDCWLRWSHQFRGIKTVRHSAMRTRDSVRAELARTIRTFHQSHGCPPFMVSPAKIVSSRSGKIVKGWARILDRPNAIGLARDAGRVREGCVCRRYRAPAPTATLSAAGIPPILRGTVA